MALVANMTSIRTGRNVANQFVIDIKHGLAFQSYGSLIAVRKGKTLYVSDKWDYSATTLKYFKQFANLMQYSKKQIQAMVDEGSIILKDEKDLEVIAQA